MHEILDSDTTKYLKRTNQRYHFRSGPEKATICYLVLPYQNALWETHFDPMCEGSDCYYGESATSMLVDRSSLNLTEEHQRRFARAMRRLALKPSVHPSQLQDVLSATSAISYCPSPEQTTSSASNKDLPEKGNEEEDLATTRRINNLEQSQWPKLMLLSDQIYSEP